ncbi:MAG: beta-hydroxyacyl-ACP dehydratase [Phycisphaerae bacterium]|nr:beta-hydroxyacyl-ACP dehydratase [Phycisphaerae bacterium]
MPEVPDAANIAARIQTILHRDLKLGSDIQLGEETPFFSAETDLDSLDMLLLVSSVEKEFGIKVPNAEVGQTVFQNIRTLTRFIQDRLAATDSGAAEASLRTDTPDALLARLPHADPFRFITRLLEVSSGVTGRAIWSLRGDEPFFAGHFPGRPIVPGVLIAEALAQLAGLVGATNESSTASLAHVDVRFERMVTPPADLILTATFKTQAGSLQQFDVVATLAEQVVAQGSVALNRQGA